MLARNLFAPRALRARWARLFVELLRRRHRFGALFGNMMTRGGDGAAVDGVMRTTKKKSSKKPKSEVHDLICARSPFPSPNRKGTRGAAPCPLPPPSRPARRSVYPAGRSARPDCPLRTLPRRCSARYLRKDLPTPRWALPLLRLPTPRKSATGKSDSGFNRTLNARITVKY